MAQLHCKNSFHQRLKRAWELPEAHVKYYTEMKAATSREYKEFAKVTNSYGSILLHTSATSADLVRPECALKEAVVQGDGSDLLA